MLYSSYDQFDNFCQSYNSDFIDSLATASSSLHNNSFVHFDLNLSNDDFVVFNQLTSAQNKDDCYFDECLNCDNTKNQTQALIDCINNSSDSEATIINQAVSIVIKLANDIKITLGNPHDYILVQFRNLYNNLDTDVVANNNQDWHIDSLYSDFAQRTIITFKGNPTDFYPLASDKRNEYNDLYNIYNSGQNYSALQDFIDPALISNPKTGQGTIFTNLADNAAVHAIPKSGGELGSTRIVLIIDIASKETMDLFNNRLIEDEQNPRPINQTPIC